MATGQLWLFDPPRPLVERFGAEFFRSLPTEPGVYLMCGETEGVLYVGKARNLRKRLATYRVANPERFPRRVIRLLFQVRRIEWDVCATESAAEAREADLICVLNPKFNRAGKVWPGGPPGAHQFRNDKANPLNDLGEELGWARVRAGCRGRPVSQSPVSSPAPDPAAR